MTPASRILVVDDEPTVLGTTARLLAVAGYDVVQAKDGEEALRLLGKHKPHLALIDVVMPGMDGYELCRRIKSDPENAAILVVMITSFKKSSADQVAGLESGADDFLVRPMDNSQLLARVNAVFRLIHAREQLQAANDQLEQRVKDCVKEYLRLNKALETEIELRKQAEEAVKREHSLL